MSAVVLQHALAAIGVDAEVEERGRVAVLRPRKATPMAADIRRRIVALGREHGFSNVSLELTSRDANLPGD